MATEYALQHRTSKRYVAVDPLLLVHVETPDQDKAFTWRSMTESVIAQEGMEEFGTAWDSVPVQREPRPLYPIEREGPR